MKVLLDRGCSNYIWMINKFIALNGANYLRGWTVIVVLLVRVQNAGTLQLINQVPCPLWQCNTSDKSSALYIYIYIYILILFLFIGFHVTIILIQLSFPAASCLCQNGFNCRRNLAYITWIHNQWQKDQGKTNTKKQQNKIQLFLIRVIWFFYTLRYIICNIWMNACTRFPTNDSNSYTTWRWN